VEIHINRKIYFDNFKKHIFYFGGNLLKSIKIVIISGICVAVAVGSYFTLRYLLQLQDYKTRISSIVISNVNLKSVPNGIYKGSYDAIMIAADVSVSVQNHTIKSITLLRHKNERGKKAEVIVNKVVAAQSLKVDTISGATNSSKVILKAIENALESGKIR
jgi:uncharacterized protein with FMN-binding domain